jgi:exodeoxyribonuclease X
MSGSAIILDTETTGFDEPEVIELAFLGPFASPLPSSGPAELLNFRPSKPIQLGALATHHIIEDDLESFPNWPGAWMYPDGVEYLIGHSIDFDWKAIGSPPNVKRICTLALARHVWPKLDSHSLSALIFHIYPRKMARDLVKNAHNAAADVDLCARVLDQVQDAVGRPTTLEQLWQASEKARVPRYFTFGKYGPQDGKLGMPIEEVRRMDPGYIRWCLSSCDQVRDDPYYQKALRGEA